MGPHCLPQNLLKHCSRREKQTTFVAIGALRVKKCHPVVDEISLAELDCRQAWSL